MIRLVLIDDHVMIHNAVRFQLTGAPDIELAGAGTCGEDIEPLLVRFRPDVLLIDLSIPPSAGDTVRTAGRYPVLPAVKQLRKAHPATKIVILSGDVTDALLESALETGVAGYLLKDDGMSQRLPEALRAVAAGSLYFSPEVARRIFPKPADGARAHPPRAVLTPRQIEVLLVLIADPNRPYADHARSMGLSVSTFRNHMRNIFGALNVTNAAGAIIRAVQLGALPLERLFPGGKGS